MNVPLKLTANPPTVFVTPQNTSGGTTITWNTGSPRGGTVRRAINGVNPQPFDSGSGNTDHTKPDTIQVGNTHEYRLTLTQTGTLLATLTVTARRPGPPIFIDPGPDFRIAINLLGNFGLIQLIRNLRVEPSINYADFKFTTSQPTVPIIQVAIAPPGPGPTFNPADVVYTAIPFLRVGMQHDVRVFQLLGGTTYYYIIIAKSTTPNDPPATKTGSFTTSSRSAIVHFDSIRVYRDGDPRSKGELKFSFGVYDGGSRLYLGPRPYMYYPDQGRADIGDGDWVVVNRPSIVIDPAPDTLTLYVECTDDDTELWTGLSTRGLAPPNFAPGKGYGDYDNGEWADAQEDFDISFEVHGGTFTLPFEMESPQGGVWFRVFGRIEILKVTVAMSRRTPPQFLAARTAFATEAGKITAVASAADSGRLDMFTLGPDGAIYHKPLISGVRERSRNDWENIGHGISGSVTALSLDDGNLHVLGLNQEGNVLHKYWNGEKWVPSLNEWKNIGGKFGGQITAVSTEKGRIDLFAIGSDAQVYHKTLNGKSKSRSRGDWENIGGKIKESIGSITALYSDKEYLHIFALGLNGNVIYKWLNGEDWKPSQNKWQDMGGEFSGSIVAVPSENGRLQVFVFASGRSVYSRTWDGTSGKPLQDKWDNIGTIESLERIISSL